MPTASTSRLQCARQARRITSALCPRRATLVPASQLHPGCDRTYSPVVSSPRDSTLTGHRWSRLRGALAPAEWSRLGTMLAVIVALHLIGWMTLVFIVDPARLTLGGKAFGVGVGLTAYTLGMRHAFDADHIAAIAKTPRKLLREGEAHLAG